MNEWVNKIALTPQSGVIINLHPDFPFVESILEKRGKIWVFILSVEYIPTCHIQSLSRFFLHFFQEFCKNGVKSDNSSYK